jgi:hypothetical protein
MLTSGKMLLHENVRPHTAAHTQVLTSGRMLLHENVHPHTAAHARVRMLHCNLESFDHPHYSPDLTLRLWLSSHVADFFDTDMQELFHQ